MPAKKQTATTQEAVVVPATQPEIENRAEMLEGFADLIAEQYGYKLAKKETQRDMNEATAANRKKNSEMGKFISEKLEELIEKPTSEIAEAIIAKRKERVSIVKLLKEARKPYSEKMKPLNDAIKYIEKVSVPDALRYLGKAVQPLFTVSEEIGKGIEQEKAAKAAM